MPSEAAEPAAEGRPPPVEAQASGVEVYATETPSVEVYGGTRMPPGPSSMKRTTEASGVEVYGGGVQTNALPSSSSSPPPPPPSATDQAAGTSLATLFRQIQVLQREMQALRGLLEEQGFQMERLARDQKAQYIDLDQRIVAMRQGGAAPPPGTGVEPGAGTQPPGVPPPPVPDAGAADAGVGDDERQAYTAAFSLMEGRAFAEAVAGFQKVLADYPNGQYAPNCYYWLGELFLVRNEIENARQHFVQVVNLYPEHPKVPDALYKLGVIHHRLGDSQRTLDYLNRVRNDYPDSTAADLAQKYLAELQ